MIKTISDQMRTAGDIAPARPTIIDVARAARVSPATVSNALTGRTNVDPTTQKRVEAAVRKLGYTPNLRARRLRSGHADTLAIFSSMSFAVSAGRARLGFSMEIAATAAVRSMEAGMALALIPPLDGSSPFRDLHIDGAIIIEPKQNEEELELLLSRGIPVVSIGRPMKRPSVPYVDLQPYDSARKVITHLVEQSSRKVGLIVAKQSRFTHMETERAYRDIMRECGLEIIVRKVDEADGDGGGYHATLDLIETHPKVDALYVSVDAFAIGARRAAADLGLSIPQQLKLATRYDGNLARECDPPVTALNLHLEEAAKLAIDQLLKLIRGEKVATSIVAPVSTLIVRRSSKL